MKKDCLGTFGLALIVLSFFSFAGLAAFAPVGSPDASWPLYLQFFDYGLTYWIREVIFPPPLILAGFTLCCIEMYRNKKSNEKNSLSTNTGFFVGLITLVLYGLMILVAFSVHVN
jgi:hypothetical protein